MTLLKPLGRKSYGSIPHLVDSRLGKGDHHCSVGQSNICIKKTRDKNDLVVVQEKTDGSNVAVVKLKGLIIPLTRSGYIANMTKFKQHQVFYKWVLDNYARFDRLLFEGERCCGEWLYQAHGTKYKLQHEPFIIFDIIDGNEKKALSQDVKDRCTPLEFITPFEIHRDNSACSIEKALKILGKYGHHGAIDPVEGAVWRVERNDKVEFLTKFVQHDKVDGKYLDNEIYNEYDTDIKYGYKSITKVTISDQELIELGDSGWELCGILPIELGGWTKYRFIFKKLIGNINDNL